MCTRGEIQAEPLSHFEVDAMCIIRSTGAAPAASVAGAADLLAERNLRGAVLPFALWKGEVAGVPSGAAARDEEGG